MKATRQFLPSAISPPAVEEPSARTSPSFTCCPLLTIGRWWMIVPWFERMNLFSGYSSFFEPWVTTICSESTWVTSPAFAARTTSPVSTAARRSIPVPISGGSGFSSGTAWRCMFEPISARLASSCSRNGISAVATDQIWVGETSIRSTSLGSRGRVLLLGGTDEDARAFQFLRLRIDLGVRLGDHFVLLLGRVEVDDLVADDAVLDLPVGGRDEAVLGDLGVGGQRADQADVRALRGLDRAHPAVVGRVHVADLDRGPLTGQATGAERREPTPVGEAGERVGLVHELRQLRGAEELLQRRDDRADVDDRLRGDRVGVFGRQPLADDALHPVEADPEGLLDQLADRAQAPVAEVLVLVEVLVDRLARVGDRLRGIVFDRVLLVDLLGDAEQLREADQLLDQGDDVVVGQDPVVEVDVEVETGVELVAADPGQVVALGVEEELLEQVFGGVDRGRLARTLLFEQLDQGALFGPGRLGVGLDRVPEVDRVVEHLEEFLVLDVAHRAQQDRDRQFALAVDADEDFAFFVDFELQPGAAGRHQVGDEDLLFGVLRRHHVGARRAHELGDDDALGAVDDEGAAIGHPREVAHEDGLLTDLAGLFVLEGDGRGQRPRVGHVLLAALLDRVRRILELELAEDDREVPRVVLDRGYVVDRLSQATLLRIRQLFEGATLNIDQVGDFEGVL